MVVAQFLKIALTVTTTTTIVMFVIKKTYQTTNGRMQHVQHLRHVQFAVQQKVKHSVTHGVIGHSQQLPQLQKTVHTQEPAIRMMQLKQSQWHVKITQLMTRRSRRQMIFLKMKISQKQLRMKSVMLSQKLKSSTRSFLLMLLKVARLSLTIQATRQLLMLQQRLTQFSIRLQATQQVLTKRLTIQITTMQLALTMHLTV